ncbi:MAG: ABC transporter permease [Verrucomicrobia bacterium]|nr:ABC transporter permease [Verrucomicrobiota bacterium]
MISPARLSRALRFVNRLGAVWIAVILLYLVSGLISPGMFQINETLNILQIAAFLGIVAIGQTLALLVGGIDLSVAGVVTMSNIVVTSLMLGQSETLVPSLLISILLAAAVGFINGSLITLARVTPLVATLGTNSILFGASLVYTGGAPHGSISPAFAVCGQGHIFGLPVSTVCWLAIGLTMAWITRQTTFGRKLYAVGANPAAARLMGIPVNRILISAYVLSSVMACLGGLLLTSYIGLPSLGIGDQFLLTSVAAVVVGGTALSGGWGSIVGTIGGAIFITELNSFTNIVRVSTGSRFVLQGAVIALSVLMYHLVGSKRTSS